MDCNARGRLNPSENCSLYILDNYYITTDRMIQNLLDYYSFSKDRVFEYLFNIFNRKLHYQNTYSRSLRELSMEVENKARQSHRFGECRRHALQLASAYEQVFLSIRQELITEIKQIQSKQQLHEQTYIQILQSCKLSHIENQKHFIQHAQKQLSEEAGKIGQKVKQIQNNQSQADRLKFESFGEMLLILKQFDQEMIRQKYQLQQSEKNFKYFGSKRSQMNEKLDQISAIEQQIKSNINQIRYIQKQRQEFCEKVCQKLDKIEMDKLQCLQKICYTFKQQFKPLSAQITYKDLIDLRPIDIPFISNKQFLDNYKKSIYLLLNPHPQNKLLIDHRQSLATKVSLSSFKQNRKAQTFEALSLDFQVQDNKDTQKYNDYVEFVYRIRSTIACAYLTDEEIDMFFQYFHANMRKKPLREVFLFYLYELGKTESRLIGLVCKEPNLLVRMLGLFFKECLNLYDSQSAIKALMLIYHIQLPDSPSIHLNMLDQPIWKSFQFWETSFLESLYEYFEMVVIYYHNLVQKPSQKSQTNHNNWFANIFKIFPKTQEKNKVNPQEALREFYHQIFQNLTIIYLANMIMMHVPHAIVDKFKKYISEGVIKLKWSPQYSENLQSFMRSVCSKSQNSLKKLLTNDNILDRVMSKLIGSQQQEKKESVSLSNSIREWLSSDR